MNPVDYLILSGLTILGVLQTFMTRSAIPRVMRWVKTVPHSTSIRVC